MGGEGGGGGGKTLATMANSLQMGLMGDVEAE